jgi:HK97 family phage major capsid protein
MKPVKIEYGARVSQEFIYATDEVQIQYLSAFADGFSKKVARGFDIMAFHGFNPRTKAASSVIGNNHFDYAVPVANVVTMSDDGDDDVEQAIAKITAAEEDVTGIAMSPAFRSVLAAQTKQDGSKLFPELAWGAVPGALHGLPVQVNSTVNFDNATPVHKDRAIIGNFRDYFRWGYAKEIPLKVIEYGNPDNDAVAGDLQGHNQVYLRAEVFIGWGILVPEAFARIVAE